MAEKKTLRNAHHLLWIFSIATILFLLTGAFFAHAADTVDVALQIPVGGTTPLGAVGFVNAGFELAGQVGQGALPMLVD